MSRKTQTQKKDGIPTLEDLLDAHADEIKAQVYQLTITNQIEWVGWGDKYSYGWQIDDFRGMRLSVGQNHDATSHDFCVHRHSLGAHEALWAFLREMQHIQSSNRRLDEYAQNVLRVQALLGTDHAKNTEDDTS